jgi:hypothetical protein
MKHFFWIVVLSFASAQELPCAKLLENLPSSSLAGIRTIELTHTINYVENGPDAQSTLRYVKDFVNDKAYLEHDVGYGYLVYRYHNGVGTVEENGKTKEAPAEEDLVSIREATELLEFDMRAVFAKDGVQSCDGEKTYGSFSGEQVTVSSAGEETFLLFDDTGQVFALASYYSGGELVLAVLDEFVVENGLFQRGKISTYEMRGNEVVLLEESLLEVTAYNQELDESLFVPKE